MARKNKWPFGRKKPGHGWQEGPSCWGLVMSPREPSVPQGIICHGKICIPRWAFTSFSCSLHVLSRFIIWLGENLHQVIFFFNSVVTRNVPNEKCKWHEDLSRGGRKWFVGSHGTDNFHGGWFQIAVSYNDESLDWLIFTKKKNLGHLKRCFLKLVVCACVPGSTSWFEVFFSKINFFSFF